MRLNPPVYVHGRRDLMRGRWGDIWGDRLISMLSWVSLCLHIRNRQSLPFQGLAGPAMKGNWLKISLARLEMMLAGKGNIWNSGCRL